MKNKLIDFVLQFILASCMIMFIGLATFEALIWLITNVR